MEFKDIRELDQLMNSDQMKEAKYNFEKFYQKPFGSTDPILCSSEDDASFLTKVDVEEFN